MRKTLAMRLGVAAVVGLLVPAATLAAEDTEPATGGPVLVPAPNGAVQQPRRDLEYERQLREQRERRRQENLERERDRRVLQDRQEQLQELRDRREEHDRALEERREKREERQRKERGHP